MALETAYPVGHGQPGNALATRDSGIRIELERRLVFAHCKAVSFRGSLVLFLENGMKDLQTLLDVSARNHSHLCPRQILGVRIGLAGLSALGFAEPPAGKRLLVILETDGCFADGVSAATDCNIGHRTLRVEDYGKTAATFVNTQTGRAIRVAPAPDIRQQADACLPDEPRHYFAQMQAYRVIPDERLLSVAEVQLMTPVEKIVSRPGVRANCDICGEEILNEREIHREGLILCHTCGGTGYYRDLVTMDTLRVHLRTA